MFSFMAVPPGASQEQLQFIMLAEIECVKRNAKMNRLEKAMMAGVILGPGSLERTAWAGGFAVYSCVARRLKRISNTIF